MRFPVPLLIGALLVPMPLLAQPPADRGGPLAADADDDGMVTRNEMMAWVNGQFAGMDSDGDGSVPVQAMRQMLGQDQQGDERAGQADAREGRGGPPGGMGRGGPGGPGGAGGPPPGGRPPRDDRARADHAAPPGGSAMPRPEDSNDDGVIDRAEFTAPMLAMFADLDRDQDGVLSGDELPPPPPSPKDAPQPD